MQAKIRFENLNVAILQQSLGVAVGIDGGEIQHGRFLATERLEAQLLPVVGHAGQRLCYLGAIRHLHHKDRPFAFNDQLDRALRRGQPVVDAGAAALIKAVASEKESLGQELALG
ncbi:hypothetical protein MNKW57_14520 [Biformimicrobium ophioploci]|uniref:Uncharacterized protein n=1 Tax=Biformimicrobium ophioploci TaxID=3036711 RepID=A0ABQ6LYE7_9GAMM|nr:hypothetical protein MNKW57_14520 [Microbulbifer sp. NKW57]